MASKVKNIIFYIEHNGLWNTFIPPRDKHAANGDWKIPILGKEEIFELWQDKKVMRVIKKEDFTELSVRADGRRTIIVDSFHFLSKNQPDFQSVQEENRKLRQQIEDLKEELINSRAETVDIKEISDLSEKKEKQSNQKEKDITEGKPTDRHERY
jgi:hypothetical protein